MGPQRPKRPTWHALAGVACASLLLLTGLALGRDDGGGAESAEREERDNRARATLKDQPTTTSEVMSQFAASSTTTTVAPGGPVLGEPVGASLLMARTGSRWVWVDLDTGERQEVLVPADEPFGAVPVRDGVVVLRAGRAWLHALPGGDPTELGPAYQLLASGLPDRIWLVAQRPPPGQETGATATLVDLSGAVMSEVALPSAYVEGGTADGVVFTAGGRTYLGRSFGVEPVAQGNALAASARQVVVLACDDGAVCRPGRHDLDTGETLLYVPIPDPFNYDVSAVLAPDGRLVEVTYGASNTISLFTADGQLLGQTNAPGLQGDPVWLPDALGLLAPTGSGVRRVRAVDGEVVLEPIPALAGTSGGVPYVIPR